MKISGLILAAGAGQRMGGNKALVSYRGRSLLSWSAEALRGPGRLADLCVITGAQGEIVAGHAKELGLALAHNTDFATGLMSSLQVGIRSLPESTEAALVALVDQPLIGERTVCDFLTECQSSPKGLRSLLARPVFQGGPGHPCVIGRDFFAEILQQPPQDRGANFLFQKYRDQVLRFDVQDPGVVIDFDRVSDLEDACYAGRISECL